MKSLPTRPSIDAARRIAVLTKAMHDLQADRFSAVSTRCAALLTRDPGDSQAALLSGLAAGARGLTEHAAQLLTRAARERGNAAHPFHDLAVILRRTGRAALIEAQFDALRRLAPNDVALLQTYAEVLYDSGQNEAAIAILHEALLLQPDVVPARNLLAMALASVGRTEDALIQLQDAVRRDPCSAGIWANLGLLLKDDGRFEEALAAYDHAVALAPDDAQIRVNRVVARLRAGLWAEAWPDYELRLELADHANRQPGLLPAVAESGDLTGRTIVVVHEDGFGDSLHFARYLQQLAARGAHVIASVPARLTRIMQTVPGVAAIHNSDDALPQYDFYCPFFSLPRAFATTPDSIPAPVPYLHATAEATAHWNDRLPLAAVRVGLVWAGQARPALPGFITLDGRRSMELSALAPLATVPGVLFVSLQHGSEAAQAGNPPPGMTMFDPMQAVTDFADTAGIIANLDLVITVDTAVAHLAGGMGKPVFLLDRYDHCWRWLSGRADSPWYPAMRIFRQAQIGDWGSVLRPVTTALAAFASGLRSGRTGDAIGVDLLEIPETIQRDA